MKGLKLLSFSFFILLIFSCSEDELVLEQVKMETHPRSELMMTPAPSFNSCDLVNLFVLVDLEDCKEGTKWDCAIINAIDAYNDLPCGIGINMTLITNINELPTGESINIEITCADIEEVFSTPLSDAIFANTDITPGEEIIALTSKSRSRSDLFKIRLNFEIEDKWPCETDSEASCCQLQRVAMKELGRAINYGTAGGVNNTEGVLETVNENPASIFTTITTTTTMTTTTTTSTGTLTTTTTTTTISDPCDDDICKFTDEDIQALEALFPACGDCFGVQLEVDGNLYPGNTIEVTSIPENNSSYTVWAIFDGIPSRFFVHEHCGDQPLTTNFILQNDPVMECSMELYVEQCGEIIASETYSLGSISAIYPSINDSYPQLGEEVEIKTVCNGKADYLVRLKYELNGQVQYQPVTNVNCNSSSSTMTTLWNNPALAYKTVTIEGIRNGAILGTKTFTIFPQ